jgi:predicted MFS family arabinose efflux permease
MGVILASWPFGIAVALLSQGELAETAGWRVVMFAAAALCAAALALVLGVYRPPGVVRGRTASASPVSGATIALPAREALPVVVAGLIWGIFNVGLVLFFSFVTPLMLERGHSPLEAGALTSTGLWISMLSVPLCGFAVERGGCPDRAIVLFSIAAGIVLALLPVLSGTVVLCALFGLLIGPPAGAIMALPARALSASGRAVGLGVFYTCYYGVMAAGPAIAGLLRDAFGTAAAALYFGGGLFLAVAPLLAAFHALRSPRAGG